MAPFKFGKKNKNKTSSHADTSITSNDSANTTADTSRPSISSNHQNLSAEQTFKNNILSNMMKKSDQRNVSTSTNNNEEATLSNQKILSALPKSEDNTQSHNNIGKDDFKMLESDNVDFKKNVYSKINGHNHQNSLNSPFSLQSPSFTIVADSDKHSTHNNLHTKQPKDLSSSKIFERDQLESANTKNAKNHNSQDSFSSTKDMQSIQNNPDLWLTEDDMFLLKPWDRIKLPISPFPRYRHAASNVSITVNNDSDSLISSDLYLIGGLHGNSVYGDTWKLRFTRRSVNNVDILEHFGSLNKTQNDQKHPAEQTNNFSNYHIESKKYKLACSSTSIKISNQTPPPRVGHASVMCGNAFIVFGGDTLKLNSKKEMDDDIYLFNINTKRWTIPNPIGKRPCGRYGHKITVIQHAEGMKDSLNKANGGTKLFLFGGQFDDLYFNDLYSFNLASFRKTDSHWDVVKPESFSPPPMSNHVMCTFDNKLYVFGGETVAGLLNDIFMYDPATNDWQFIVGKAGRQQDGVPKPRQEHSCLVYKNLMCVYGGKDSEGNYLSDLWFFNFMSQKWFKFPEEKTEIIDKIKENKVSPNCLEYQPLGRSGHSMSLLQKESKILIMGGDKLDYNTTLDLNDVFAITNDIDFEDIDGESNQHIFGTTVYTFDLTCLKEFIPDIYDFSNESSLDLLNIPSPPKAVDTTDIEEEVKKVEELPEEYDMPKHSKTEESEEVVEPVIDHNKSLPQEMSIPIEDVKSKGNQKITVSRNSFPMLNQLKNQEKITPTETAFDLPGEETSQVGGKDSAAGVSDFFDNYNDDEISVQLRNSMNSTHILSSAMKANVIDHDISIGEESDDKNLAEPLEPKYDVMFETDSIEYHQNPGSENSLPDRENVDTRETLAAEKSNSDHESHHSIDLKSSGTEVEKEEIEGIEEKGAQELEENKESYHVPVIEHEEKKEVKERAIEPLSVPNLSAASTEQTKIKEEELPLTKNVEVINEQRDNILEEILKLREETFNAARETSKIIKSLEKQVRNLQKENTKLVNEIDGISLQVDELNIKNMELISVNADLHQSKKTIINAMKLALSQIEKGHL